MAGQAIEEAAFDFENLVELNLPDLSCITQDWPHLHDKLQEIIANRKWTTLETKAKRRLDLAKFRINSQVSIPQMAGSN